MKRWCRIWKQKRTYKLKNTLITHKWQIKPLLTYCNSQWALLAKARRAYILHNANYATNQTQLNTYTLQSTINTVRGSISLCTPTLTSWTNANQFMHKQNRYLQTANCLSNMTHSHINMLTPCKALKPCILAQIAITNCMQISAKATACQ